MPQRENSKASRGPSPEHPEHSSQSTSNQQGTSSTTKAASSRNVQPSVKDGQAGVQSTSAAASEQACRRQSSGTSRADGCAPRKAGTEGSSGELPGDAAGGLALAAGQQEPEQAANGTWWPPNLAAWLLPRDAGGPEGGSGRAAGQQIPAHAGSEGGKAWWPLKVAAWLLPGSTAQTDQPSQRSQTDASGGSPVRNTVRAAGEAGSVESGGKSVASAEQPSLKAHPPRGKPREPSQTPAHRRMSEGTHTCQHVHLP